MHLDIRKLFSKKKCFQPFLFFISFLFIQPLQSLQFFIVPIIYIVYCILYVVLLSNIYGKLRVFH